MGSTILCRIFNNILCIITRRIHVSTLFIQRVNKLPDNLTPSTMYVVKSTIGNVVEIYFTDANGTAVFHSITYEEVSRLINSAIDSFTDLLILPDILSRNKLNPVRNELVLVLDATGDPSVNNGAALYVYDYNTNTWYKVSEFESLDITLDWGNIAGRPVSLPANIDNSVSLAHTHSNRSVLDLLSADDTGNLLYDNNPVTNSNIRVGSGAPDTSIGDNGSYYLDNTTNMLYGPKTNGAWGVGVSLIGNRLSSIRDTEWYPDTLLYLTGTDTVNTLSFPVWARSFLSASTMLLGSRIESVGNYTLINHVLTLDCSSGNYYAVSLDQDITEIILQSIPGYIYPITIKFTQDNTGGRVVDGWPAYTQWYEDTPVSIISTANAVDIIRGYVDETGILRIGKVSPGIGNITLNGDVSGSGSDTISVVLNTVNSNAGVYGDNFHIPMITVNDKGLVTNVSTADTQVASTNIIGNINLKSQVTDILPIENGGTGAYNKTTAFDILSPAVNKGDILVHNGVNNSRLPVGSDDYVLTADSSQPAGLKWVQYVGGGATLTANTSTNLVDKLLVSYSNNQEYPPNTIPVNTTNTPSITSRIKNLFPQSYNKEYDPYGLYDNTTGLFTAAISGTYRFDVSCEASLSNGQIGDICIVKNDNTFFGGGYLAIVLRDTASWSAGNNISAVGYLKAGDTLSLHGFYTSAGSTVKFSAVMSIKISLLDVSATQPNISNTTPNELDYVALTASVNITSIDSLHPTIITVGKTIIYDGFTRIKIEFMCPQVNITSADSIQFMLYDGETPVCPIGCVVSSSAMNMPIKLETFITPTIGAHIYSVRGYSTTGTQTLVFDTNGAGYYRITNATPFNSSPRANFTTANFCTLYMSSDQSISGNTVTTLTLNSVNAGSSVYYNAATNPNGYTIPPGMAGYYRIDGLVAPKYTGGPISIQELEVSLIINGMKTYVFDQVGYSNGGTTPPSVHISCPVVYLNTGDIVYLQVWYHDYNNVSPYLFGSASTSKSFNYMTITQLGIASNLGNSQVGGRLSLLSGDPTPTADQINAFTIYYTPYKHNQLSLYYAGCWVTTTFTETALSLNGLIANRPYDVFGYLTSSGVLGLEILAWIDSTTRAVGLVRQDGVLSKAGDTTRRYLGSFYATSSNTTEDSLTNRLLFNIDNQVRRYLSKQETTASWSADNMSISSFRPVNNSTNNRVNVMCGYIPGTYIDIRYTCMCNIGNSSYVQVGIGEDSTTISSSNGGSTRGSYNAVNLTLEARIDREIPLGYHYYQALELAETATVIFYNPDPSPHRWPQGINGYLLC